MKEKPGLKKTSATKDMTTMWNIYGKRKSEAMTNPNEFNKGSKIVKLEKMHEFQHLMKILKTELQNKKHDRENTNSGENKPKLFNLEVFEHVLCELNNFFDKNGNNALHYAVQNGLAPELGLILVYCNPEMVNLRNSNDKTPYQEAVEIGKNEIVDRIEKLAKVKINSDEEDLSQQTQECDISKPHTP